jgi:type IV pilus assembly protein PilB
MARVAEETILDSVAPLVRIAYNIIHQAIKDNASEIVVEPGPDKTSVYYCIDHLLHWMFDMPSEYYPRLVTLYKVMTDVSWASRQQPLTGHLRVRHSQSYYDLEVTFPPRLLERITMRIIPGPEAEGDDEDATL